MHKIYTLLLLACLSITLVDAQYNVQLLARKTYSGQNLSGSWGYVDPVTQKEYGLIGTSKGLSIVDVSIPTSPVEVKFIPGSNGLWRECQTYRSYAYITQDNNGNTNSEGILIYDLSTLPAGKVDTFRGTTINDSIFRTHSLYVDTTQGFLYLNGGRFKVGNSGQNGVAIYDLKPNPKKPVFVGYTPSAAGTSLNYVHDCYVRNNIMYQAHVYNNRFTVWDVTNKANPVKLQDFTTAYSTVHNMWLSVDSKTLFVTHEVYNYPVEAFDVSNLNNIRKLSEFKVNPTNQEIAHNVHVIDENFAYTSYYSDGLAIFDISDPNNVITVGYYDTQPGSTRTENGVWGAYGYYHSGIFTLSDMIAGMFVVKPTLVRAARIVGTVTDTNTNAAIIAATMTIVDTTITATTDFSGKYRTGTAKAGSATLKFEKTGYITKYVTLTLTNGKIDTVNVKLRQIPFVKNTVNTQFCEGNSYLLPDGRAVSLPGIYESVVATSSSGLDTVIITNLTQNPSYQFTQSAEICQGENFTLPWGGTANTSGLYQHNYQTTKGCDSVLAINLTVNPAYNIEFNPVICIGESYNLPWGGTAATQGTYQHNYAAVSGCDSVVKVYLSVSPVYDITKFDTILQGETFTLPDGNQTSIAGTYQSNLLTTSSCDSVIHTVLFVKDTSTVTAIKTNFQKFNFYYSSQQNAVIIQPSTTFAIAQLEIFNATGELIYKNEQAENKYVLPDLANGLYLVKALSKNKDLYSGKFIKQ